MFTFFYESICFNSYGYQPTSTDIFLLKINNRLQCQIIVYNIKFCLVKYIQNFRNGTPLQFCHEIKIRFFCEQIRICRWNICFLKSSLADLCLPICFVSHFVPFNSDLKRDPNILYAFLCGISTHKKLFRNKVFCFFF